MPPPSEPPPPSRRAAAFFGALTRLQVLKPFHVLAVSLIITLFTGALATRLRVLTGFENLLPEDRASVKELSRVAAHTAGVSMMFVVLRVPADVSPPPTEALRKAADQIVPEVKKLGAPWVGSAESGVHDAITYLSPRAGLYAEREKLEKLRSDIDARYVYEVNKASGADLGFDDEVPPEINLKRVEETFGVDRVAGDRYPDGYYQSKDGRVVVVAIRSKIAGSDLEHGTEAIKKVREVVERVNPSSFDPRITYGLSGDLVTAVSEYSAINNDLRDVGLFGAFLITAVVLIYYLRLRTLVTMVTTMIIGVTWTFGLTQVTVGHLNLATGFLFTIIAGNGINAGIIFMARYLELRRGGARLADAIETSHRETWLPTITAAAAASVSFASLMVTEFRGFRDFGFIGGFGMMICWIATYWSLPAILAVTEKVAPLDGRGIVGTGPLARFRRQGGIAFGRPFAAIVARIPKTVTVVGLIFGAVGIAAGVLYVKRDPMEYDLKQLRTDPHARAKEIELTTLADSITGHVGADGMAILVERSEQVPLLEKALRARRDAAPPDSKPFADVHALQDFVPSEQAEKIPTLLAIKEKVLKSHRKGLFKEDEWKEIERFIPPDDLKPFTIDDLPEEIARVFTESDGRRGRVVFISPTDVKLVDDAHYLFRWADSYRETKLADGSVVLGSGRAVIYADMWSAIINDVPKAVLCSLITVVAAVLIAFRAGRPALAVLAGLAVGVAWMALVLVLLGVRLNFLNFIALPITFGIGVDYAVNIVQRYVRDGVGSALNVVRETGGAVILCSMTTTLGYLALVGSSNYGVRSLGVAAVVGEICCMLAAVLVVPAAFVWIDGKRKTGEKSAFSVRPPRPSKAPSMRPPPV